LLEIKDYKLDKPLVSFGDIPEALLLETELEAYAKLRKSGVGVLEVLRPQ
jgi:hypothetical protein